MNKERVGSAFPHGRLAVAVTILAALAECGYGDILATSASVKPDNSLIVDIQVTTAGCAVKAQVTYQTDGVDPLVSPWTPVSTAGPATITIGRIRANRTYTYKVHAIDKYGVPAGTADGSFTTGPLPQPLTMNTYTLTGHTTVPLVILSDTQAGFNGFVGLDLHSADAPQIVWYYSNAPSDASGTVQIDKTNAAIIEERQGVFIFADAGSGPEPNAADSFYREFTSEGTILSQSPVTCSITAPPPASPAPRNWIWGQGNDSHEVLAPGLDGVAGTALHLAKIVKDPFFDAGLAPQGGRLQSGIGIRRWTLAAGTDEIVWDPFNFLDPLTERTNAANSDPGQNSDTQIGFPCTGRSMRIEGWMHADSLQVAPTGVILMAMQSTDTVIAISPQFDRIAWRIGRFKSDFAFPNPNDKFYHEHYVRMLDSGNLLMLDNGAGRPTAEGGQYSRALELALDWDSMTATKVWEYRHQLSDGSYKYADKLGSAQRLENGNTLVLYGDDVDPTTLKAKSPQTFTLVEADANPEAGAVAVLDMLVPGDAPLYRALPVNTLFGEVPGK